MPERQPTITITDKAHGLPFSKGLLAQSFMATGLPPSKAYEVATSIQDDLREHGELSITSDRLRDMSAEYLERIERRGAGAQVPAREVASPASTVR